MFNSLKKSILDLPVGDLIYKIVFFGLPAAMICYFLTDVVVAVSLVLMFSYILIVLENMVQEGVVSKLGLSKKYSMPMLLMMLCWGAFIFVAFMFPIILEQSAHFLKELPFYYARLQDFLNNNFSEMSVGAGDNLLALLGEDMMGKFASFSKSFVNYSLASIVNISSLLIYLVLIPILTYFFVKDRGKFKVYFSQFFTKNDLSSIANNWHRVDLILTSYIRGKIIEVLVVGLSAFVLFWFMGLKYSLMLSTLVGLSVMIPFVGAFLVTLPVALVAFSQWGVSSSFVELIVAYFVLQILDGNVLVPYIFSENMNLHPAAILLSVMVFGGLFGVIGVFFAIPLLAIGLMYLERRFANS